MDGKLIGVGVGPGDPEQMTLKAVRTIREHTWIAVPGTDARESVAYRIAVQAVPELAQKRLLAIPMPMVKDREKLKQSHGAAADRVEGLLRQGEDVVFLTLGDPTIYSTYMYIHQLIRERGFCTEVVSGVPSFCAAAACLNLPLTEWSEELHIIPAAHSAREGLAYGGTRVLMKSGKSLSRVKEALMAQGGEVYMVENCGMEGQKIYVGAEELPEDAGYYTLLIVKASRGQEP